MVHSWFWFPTGLINRHELRKHVTGGRHTLWGPGTSFNDDLFHVINIFHLIFLFYY